MKIIIYWNNEESENLYDKVVVSLEELWLSSFIELKKDNNIKLKESLNIQKEPALIVEEESIDFIDIIFEWLVPSDEEINSIIISIIWWGGANCSPGWECWVSCFC